MYLGKKVVVVLPAYNAARTIEQTFAEIPFDVVDDVILCDDASSDHTAELSKALGIEKVLIHPRNRGYGANQKSLYRAALQENADIVVMLHPDYQYDPKLIPAMVSSIAMGTHDVVLGSRILGKGALTGGMPRYKYLANRTLTFLQNIASGYKLSEYHTGYRAYHQKVLTTLPLGDNSDDFLFDNQVLAQIIYAGFRIGEISCPARYFAEASSINFWKSIKYGIGVVRICMMHFIQRTGLAGFRMFEGNVTSHRKPS